LIPAGTIDHHLYRVSSQTHGNTSLTPGGCDTNI
jgi:hypothetical protein